MLISRTPDLRITALTIRPQPYLPRPNDVQGGGGSAHRTVYLLSIYSAR